jgi:hypothetical protein
MAGAATLPSPACHRIVVSEPETGDEELSAARQVLRTVTPGPRGHRDTGMDAVGWAVFLGLVVLLVPLLPVLALVWVLTKVLDWLDPPTG